MKKILAIIACAAIIFAAVPAVSAEGYDVASISAEYLYPLIENVSGHTEFDSLGREYFMYDLYDEGLMITCTYENGETETLPWYMFEDVSVIGNQGYNNQWTVGTHDVTVRCNGKRAFTTVEIIETPVDYIEAEMQRPLVKNVDGFETVDFDDNFEELQYFRYYIETDDALYLTVHMKDGSVIEGSPNDLYEATGYMAEIFDDQSYSNQWGIGAHTATVEFIGVTADFEVDIVENDLESIVVTPARDLIEGVDCTWRTAYDYETGEEIGKYPYYNVEEYLNVTVTYDDGYSIDCKASELHDMTGIGMIIDDEQSENAWWSAGHHSVSARYMGVELEFDINIVENPFSAISITESGNKELHLIFTNKAGGTVDCTAEKIFVQADLTSVYSGEDTVKAEIVTDKGTYNVRISSGDDFGDNVKIYYGTLESNTLASCDWLRVNDLAYDIAGSTVLYQIMSTVDAPVTFEGYSSDDFEKCIDYIANICSYQYLMEKIASLDADISEIAGIVDVSEEDMLVSVVADVDELGAVATELFGVECDFSVLNGYDSETNTVKIPLMYLSLLDTGVAELLAAVGDGGMDSCIYEDGKWTAAVNYDYIDYKGALQTACMTVTVSSDMKIMSVDLGIDYSDVMPGDVNTDGKVNAKDSNLLKQIIIGAHEPSAIEIAAGDLNGDKVINTKDSYLLKTMIANG